jgi:hypothetical protein
MKSKKILLVLLIAVLSSSCVSVSRYSREEVTPPMVFVERDNYQVTEDLTATAKVQVTSFLFINSIKFDDKKQLRIGPLVFGDRDYMYGTFDNYSAPKDFDEQIATYNFIKNNSAVDYVTNVRYHKVYSNHPYLKLLNIGKREMETTIIAKGIILKNKVPAPVKSDEN